MILFRSLGVSRKSADCWKCSNNRKKYLKEEESLAHSPSISAYRQRIEVKNTFLHVIFTRCCVVFLAALVMSCVNHKCMLLLIGERWEKQQKLRAFCVVTKRLMMHLSILSLIVVDFAQVHFCYIIWLQCLLLRKLWFVISKMFAIKVLIYL